MSTTDTDEELVISEKELHYEQKEKPIQNHGLQFKIRDKKSEVPEHDTGKVQQVKSALKSSISNVDSTDKRNSSILHKYEVETAKFPKQFEQLKIMCYREMKKNKFLEQELKKYRNDTLGMKRCHNTFLNKAVSISTLSFL